MSYYFHIFILCHFKVNALVLISSSKEPVGVIQWILQDIEIEKTSKERKKRYGRKEGRKEGRKRERKKERKKERFILVKETESKNNIQKEKYCVRDKDKLRGSDYNLHNVT